VLDTPAATSFRIDTAKGCYRRLVNLLRDNDIGLYGESSLAITERSSSRDKVLQRLQDFVYVQLRSWNAIMSSDSNSIPMTQIWKKLASMLANRLELQYVNFRNVHSPTL